MSDANGVETSMRDHIARIVERLSSGECHLIIEHPNPAEGTSVFPPRVAVEVGNRLSASIPAEIGELVERLEETAIGCDHMTEYGLRDMCNEAASLIQSQAAESAADKARIAELTDMVAALADALEVAREDVEHWGGYAGEYFREKHDLDGDLDRISKQAADARALLNRRAEG